MSFAAIVREPIEPAHVLSLIGADQDGASLLFVGVVRDHNDGRSVGGVRYDAYEEMAARVLSEIVDEAARSAHTDRVAAVHRIGVECKLCNKPTNAATAHLHQDEYVGECCWDERLRVTE